MIQEIRSDTQNRTHGIELAPLIDDTAFNK